MTPADGTYSPGIAVGEAIDRLRLPGRVTAKVNGHRGPVVTAEYFEALRAERLAKNANLRALECFVADVLEAAPGKPDPAAYLKANATKLRQHLTALSKWAATDDDTACPAHLVGLTAFDLSDAAERLEADAHKEPA